MTHRFVAPLLGALAGLVAIGASLGLTPLNPAYVDWLLHGDWKLHFLGWHHYRHGAWTWPIGLTPELIWPVGSSIGLTDSIPIVAFVFKPFDALLPRDFQFIGAWFVVCFALQGVFGALLMRIVTPTTALQVLGATLVVLSPPLIFRAVHPALMAHWLILSAWWLYLTDRGDRSPRRRIMGWATVVGLAAATQPYLWLMVMAMMAAAMARAGLAGFARWRAIAVGGIGLGAWAAFVMWQCGDFIIGGNEGLTLIGVDAWSMNLLSLVMPTEGSTLLGRGWFEYAKPGQYEGYAYLGAGVLMLAGVALTARGLAGMASSRLADRSRCAATHGPRLVHVPMAIALLFLTLLALSPVVTAGSRTLFEYDYRWLGPLTLFRSSGRMFWPVYYGVVLAVLAGGARLRTRSAIVVFLLAVGVQAVDLAGSWRTLREARTWGFRDPLEDRFWQIVPARYDRVILLPTNLCSGTDSIGHTPFSLLAGRYGLAINAGITARYNVTEARAYCARFRTEVETGAIDDAALYVVQPHLVPPLEAAAGSRVLCTQIDGYGVCVARETYRGWQDDYDVLRRGVPPLDELRQVHAALDAEYRTTLGRAAQSSPSSVDERVEAVARYLSYRLSGCPHAEAAEKTLNQILGATELRSCLDRSAPRALPGAHDVFDFRTRLDAVHQARADPASIERHLDLEGEAVWLLDYVQRRLGGAAAQAALSATLAAVRAAASRN